MKPSMVAVTTYEHEWNNRQDVEIRQVAHRFVFTDESQFLKALQMLRDHSTEWANLELKVIG